jgi:hypothetical protein
MIGVVETAQRAESSAGRGLILVVEETAILCVGLTVYDKPLPDTIFVPATIVPPMMTSPSSKGPPEVSTSAVPVIPPTAATAVGDVWPTWHTYVTPAEVTRSPTWYLVARAHALTIDGKRSGERVKGVV